MSVSQEDALREKLRSEIDRVSIKPLIPHFERDALFLVDDSLEILDVGIALATDQVEQCSKWLTDNQLVRPTKEQMSSWTENVLVQHFEFLVVQPFVLAKVHEGGEADWRLEQAKRQVS